MKLDFLEARNVSERQVQAVWYDGNLRPTRLRTESGEPLRVIDSGIWNLEAGPDFKNAVLAVGMERRRVFGDVEIHVDPADWTAHGHSSDPRYSRVVLHVTWFAGKPPPGLPRGCMSVCIGEHAVWRDGFDLANIDVGAYPFACIPRDPRPCEKILRCRPDDAYAVLRAAGRARIMRKARRLGAIIIGGASHDQLFYEEVFVSLGYKYNSFPFRDIALQMPWKYLPSDCECAAAALACIANMKVTHETPWRRANVRPGNTPERRLRAAAALFCQGTVLRERLAACDLSSKKGQRKAASILCESGLLGERRAGAIMANVLVPFALAEGRLADVPEWILPEDVSSPVRQAAFRLFGRDHNPSRYIGNGLFIQGLLHIHREFCLSVHPDCSSCALAASLVQPSSNEEYLK